MMYFKACQKCAGDLTLEKDSYGSYLKCLQCGKYTELNEVGDTRSMLHGSVSDQGVLKLAVAGSMKAAAA
ncbi:MAG: hypothetical protein O3A93_11035 [Chloroflexi bacterium]|nr:hypothetical protein [Chloroflexota bacterium]MDA1271776.1 hypothetical protein [Chloroflexota bacterium]PKB59397.1 MAG: hypothetical protein BZY83_02015 [SAR202 cluster bacterium Casp-Chloro-G2]